MKKCVVLLVFVIFSVSVNGQDRTGVPYKMSDIDYAPDFPGGYNAFVRYVADSFRMPDYEGTGGILKMRFIIEIDGSVTNVTVLEKVDADSVGLEAKRVIAASPRWIAGELGGKKVRSVYEFPIKIANQSN